IFVRHAVMAHAVITHAALPSVALVAPFLITAASSPHAHARNRSLVLRNRSVARAVSRPRQSVRFDAIDDMGASGGAMGGAGALHGRPGPYRGGISGPGRVVRGLADRVSSGEAGRRRLFALSRLGRLPGGRSGAGWAPSRATDGRSAI